MLGFENVPKGKRLKYFKDYYLISTIGLIIIIIMVISILKATVFRTKEDINILVTGAGMEYTKENSEAFKNAICDNYDIDLNGDGKEKLVVDEAFFVVRDSVDYRYAEQDIGVATKLAAVLETSFCTIQIVDEHMYTYLLGENMIETYENMEKYGLKGEGYIKIPLSETNIDPKTKSPLYLTIRPEATSRLKPEEYKKHIELVKQIIK